MKGFEEGDVVNVYEWYFVDKKHVRVFRSAKRFMFFTKAGGDGDIYPVAVLLDDDGFLSWTPVNLIRRQDLKE